MDALDTARASMAHVIATTYGPPMTARCQGAAPRPPYRRAKVVTSAIWIILIGNLILAIGMVQATCAASVSLDTIHTVEKVNAQRVH